MLPIAIYHLSIKIISRGKGKSAVAAAAYRSGETITNEYDGMTHDYTRKGGVVHTEILLPGHAPAEYADRAILWNAVEKCERYKTAQLAREIEIALPAELTREQNISLARRYVKEQFVEKGMCADICVHDKGDGNPHAHIMLTLRPIENDGTWGQKSHTEDGVKIPTVDWNERERAENWRKAWAAYCNAALQIHGHGAVVDHRSYARQGLDVIPTVHLGAAAFQMEKRGIHTERGNINREIEVSNQRLRQLKARISKLQNWLKEEAGNAEPPTLADVVQGILARDRQSGNGYYSSTYNLKAAADMLNFLTVNRIMDLDGLDAHFKGMIGRQLEIRDKLKPIDRRLATLDQHIGNAEAYLKHREIYRQYKQQKPKKQAEFYESHRAALMQYESAERYLNGVMNGRTTLPTNAWRKEHDRLAAGKKQLDTEYRQLKTEVGQAEKIRSAVHSIMRREQRREQPRRAQDVER